MTVPFITWSCLLLTVLITSVSGGPILMQPNGTLPTSPSFQSAVAAALAAASLTPYVPPSGGRTITNWLAIGDSYSAGVGADLLGDYDSYSQDCFRFQQAMPHFMQNSTQMPGDLGTRVMTFGSCTGALMQDVIDKQLTQGEPTHYEYTPIGKPQLATLSAGGNDVGFGDIINNCILRLWLPGNCRNTLQAQWAKINDPNGGLHLQFINLYLSVLQQGRIAGGASPAESFQLFVTGYVQFWNANNPDCDEVYWSPFCGWGGDCMYLTQALRTEMNNMVDALNVVIEGAISQVASLGVIHVDAWQEKFDGHQYCEPGTNLWDPAGDDTWFFSRYAKWQENQSTAPVDNSTDPIAALLIPPTATQSTDDQLKAVNGQPWLINPAFNSSESLFKALDEVDPNAGVPVTIMRMFHPKSFGYAEMANFNIQSIIASATGTSVDPNNPPADPPVVYIDQGNLNCKAQHNDGDPEYYFDEGGAIAAISDFCQSTVDAKIILGPGGTAIQEIAEDDGYGHHLDISATWVDGPNCPPPMDFSQVNAISTCEERLTEVIDNCDTVIRVSPYWKQGGTFFRDCISWKCTMMGQ